jgi:hypothetical protein
MGNPLRPSYLKLRGAGRSAGRSGLTSPRFWGEVGRSGEIAAVFGSAIGISLRPKNGAKWGEVRKIASTRRTSPHAPHAYRHGAGEVAQAGTGWIGKRRPLTMLGFLGLQPAARA